MMRLSYINNYAHYCCNRDVIEIDSYKIANM